MLDCDERPLVPIDNAFYRAVFAVLAEIHIDPLLPLAKVAL